MESLKIDARMLSSLPIAPHLSGICKTLKTSQFLVLTAPTAAGKSTAVPIALLKHFTGKIIMLEPRRIAAIAVAFRAAELLGEGIGGTAGYIIRMEKCVSSKSRLIVMTEGVLIRMLQDDPVLEDVDIVVIDEAHERGINTDLALAFLKEASQLRSDLRILVMSATMNTASVSKYLSCGGLSAPVINIPGRQYNVEIVYRGSKDNDIAKAASNAAADEYLLLNNGQAMLVFLPGIKEIRQVQVLLAGVLPPSQVMVLHSSITFDEQRRVLSLPGPDCPPRIILSSAIAETSLTVPGVKTVIDCGLSRISRLNVSSGMSSLVTETESVFSAEQRKGRAGRIEAGRCVRLWAESDRRVERADPEILRGDIVPLVLECAKWSGVCDSSKIQWLTCPSSGAWNGAQKLLVMLGLLEGEEGQCRITQKGMAALQLGLHPRLACVVLSGAGGENSALRDALSCAIDYSGEAASSVYMRRRMEEDILRRVKTLHLPCIGNTCQASSSRAMMLLAGFPDRLARLEDDGTTYRFPSGRVAKLAGKAEGKTGGGTAGVLPKWIVAPVVDAGERIALIKDYEALSEAEADSWLSSRTEESAQEQFDFSYKLRKTVTAHYGKITLLRREKKVTKEDYSAAVCNAVENKGFKWLPLGKESKEFLLRARFCALHIKEMPCAKNVCDEDTLQHTAQKWLAPFITGTVLTEKMVEKALMECMDSGNVDRLAPRYLMLTANSFLHKEKERSTRSNALSPCHQKETFACGHYSHQRGEKHQRLCLPVVYEMMADGGIRPTVEVIIQRVFGVTQTPRIMNVPVTFKLLSPARRPIQVTDDLNGFWHSTWQQAAKEMRGRYPKHDWSYVAPS